MIQLLAITIDERTTPADLERIRRNTFDAIREQQLSPFAGAAIIKDVVLADGIPTPIAHKLGRPVFAIPSPPRGASTTGRITESRGTVHPRDQYVVLQADGWGASITVDVLVTPL